MRKPLCIDLFCGLGGWTEGFLAEGWDVIGFDIERHVYGEQRYPAQLVLQDVLTLHGRQFREVDCIVASPPCQEFSYMAMPWSRAKQIAAAIRDEPHDPPGFPDGYTGSRYRSELTALFDACFRIQREACEVAGRHIPMVVENVKGAQPWVGPAKANFGSFYFWGDVAMVGGRVVAGGLRFGATVRAARRGSKRNPDGTNHPQGSWFAVADSKERGVQGQKVEGFNFYQHEKTGQPGGSFQSAAGKVASGEGRRTDVGNGVRFTSRDCGIEGVKQHGSGPEWFDQGIAKHPSRSDSRKAASAQIAKIPFPLSSYISRALKPAALPAQAG